MTIPQERTEALKRRAEALAAYERAMEHMLTVKRYSQEERAALDEAERHMDAVKAAETAYFGALPRTPMSQCPFCGESLVRTFDPYGLDGPWWRSSATPEEPQACRHFCVLRGAVDFDGQAARGGDFEANIGPQAPYVIPRLLELSGVVAVVSRTRMANRYLAYLVAYFAERRPPPQDLTSHWPRTNYLYATQLGEVRWRIPNDRWDFDLEPWLARGKLRWCTSDSEKFVLSSGPIRDCPFVDLSGERTPVVVHGSQCRTSPMPGERVVPPLV
jgi:hypothetical protein